MNQKTQRFATIRKIIRSELIGSQDELIARLRECGVEITQSTLSRDLKFMNVAKIPHKSKGYVYVLPNTAHHDVNVSSNISDNITSLTFSGNLGVLKTKSGYASAISVPIDNLDCPGIHHRGRQHRASHPARGRQPQPHHRIAVADIPHAQQCAVAVYI